MKKISVILPVYNSESFVEETIESVLSQTYSNFELIIINDGSTDKSSEICESKCKKDKRIKYFFKKNSGVSDTRNFALSHATGEFITFIDSDDLYDKNYLLEMVDNVLKTKADLGICAYKSFNKKEIKTMIKNDIITTDLTKIIENLQPTMLFNQIWNKIYIRKIIVDNKISFDKDLSIAEDLKFNIEYLKKCNKISYINKCLYKYRITTNGLGFKFRTDANQIKIDLVHELESLYTENHNKDYIYKSYIKQYISYFARTLDRRNKISYKNKISEIKGINSSKEFHEDIKKAVYSNNKKIKLIAKILLTRSLLLKIIIAHLATCYDKYQKKKIFKLVK